MGKVCKSKCENVEKTDSLLQTLTFLPLCRSKKLVHVSGFQKYIFLSLLQFFSGVIFIYTWDTFLGHPVYFSTTFHIKHSNLSHFPTTCFCTILCIFSVLNANRRLLKVSFSFCVRFHDDPEVFHTVATYPFSLTEYLCQS